jgi:aldose 1-epimerase
MNCLRFQENDQDLNNFAKALVLSNSRNVKIRISCLGATVTHLFIADRNGQLRDIVLGFDSTKEYETSEFAKNSYFGCIVGRVANRISHGEFEWEGHKYILSKNAGEHQIHGGKNGFDKTVWDVVCTEKTEKEASIELKMTSADKDQGYPGNLDVVVRYTLTADSAFIIEYRAISDQTTPINLTNHSYFNLSGMEDEQVLNTHRVMVMADQVLEVNEEKLPTGRILSVSNTEFDLRELKPLCRGFDHAFILQTNGDINQLAARVYNMKSGITMDVYTDRPSVQVYTADHFNGEAKCKASQAFYHASAYPKHAGICFETQGYPDAVHYPHFPSIMVQANAEYYHKTIYKFGLDE